MRFLSLRGLFLLAFVIAMPVLALPPVARWIDELLYGPPPADSGRPPPAYAPDPQPAIAEAIAPAGYFDSSPDSPDPRGLDATTAAPPLAPPVFAPVAPSALTVPTAAEAVIDDATLTRLQQIRQRLEDLGADYVVVDALGGAGGYRCLCRMLVDPRSRFTRPFEATAGDPLAAGEQVLRDVEAWRMAAVENRARPQ